MADFAAYHANLQRGSLLLEQDRAREALPFIQGAIAANPDAPQGYAELARCWNALPAERAKSIPAIDRAIGLAPNASHYFGLKSWYLVCQGKNTTALDVAKQGLAINPTCSQSLNALANAYTQLSEWKKAEIVCRHILETDAENDAALNLLAQTLRHQGLWKESRETVARLLAHQPENAFGQANAGHGALAAGDHLRANEHFLNALRMEPSSDFARSGLLESLRARIWIIRFNTRIYSFLRRPVTFLNVAAYMGAIWLFIGLVLLFAEMENHLFAQIGLRVMGCLFFGFVLYAYLSVLVAVLGNFLLLVDPLGRQALTTDEKIKAIIPGIGFMFILLLIAQAGAWRVASGLIFFFALLVFTIQFPLMKDRWLRRRESQSEN